ncbi:MAG: 2-C-methyl-D-erythritol 4-phosphate cytidylyltransferase [Spirochaetes bacterium RBG_13_51_14]|nr:MAG: 2-C-methyl-D-erythritol 4-phosphate cytidylyltransferase [Spirochaetes bacterium RBG_13_51_14]
MERTYAVILAGGRGLRLNRTTPKQFLSLGGKPIIVWSLEACHSLAEIDHILAVIPEEYITQTDEIARVFHIHKLLKIIPGGSTRQESAYNALISLPFNDEDVLIFHDAARPFIRPDTLRKCVMETKEHGASAVYVPLQDTVAEIRNDFVSTVPPRDRMYYAQTPQGFKFALIKSAHETAVRNGVTATDDVSLVLAAGYRVKMIEGEYSNFKITTDFDYQAACRMAETIHKKR